VLIFNDTFTNYYNPAVGIAGAEVLDAAGIRPRWRRTSAAAVR
jgi:Fe-S oxidoreductase